MRYFFNTEFIEDGRWIDLLSIGIVADDGRELYLENREANFNKASDWVMEHVFPNMLWTPSVQMAHINIAHEVRKFCNPPTWGNPEFWAYFSSYDWVVLCQLFGRMVDLPANWPKRCNDIAQVVPKGADVPVLLPGEAHNALADAKWVKAVWEQHIGPTPER